VVWLQQLTMNGGMPPQVGNCWRRSTASMSDVGRPPLPDTSISISSCVCGSTAGGSVAVGTAWWTAVKDRAAGLAAGRLGWDGLRCGGALWDEVWCLGAGFLAGWLPTVGVCVLEGGWMLGSLVWKTGGKDSTGSSGFEMYSSRATSTAPAPEGGLPRTSCPTVRCE
jgi:hypothetical protein